MTHRDFAINLASEAGEIIRQKFSLSQKAERKKDNSLVTKTDFEINQRVVDAIQKRFPEHGIIAEESKPTNTESEYQWVCDPIDGTLPFAHGIPVSMFSLALVKNGESILGVAYDPFSDRMFVGEKGKGAQLNGKPTYVNQESDISKAVIGASAKSFHLHEQIRLAGGQVIMVGSTVFMGTMVASGNFAATFFAHTSPWDGAAVKVIVEEAGGRVTDMFGNEQRYDRTTKGYLASNGIVHDEIVAMIKNTPIQPA